MTVTGQSVGGRLGREAVARRATLAGAVKSAKWRRIVLPWLFLLPIVILNVVVILGPSIASVGYVFTKWSGIGAAEFVGLANFREMLQDRVFKIAFVNNMKWTFYFVTIAPFLSLMGAWLLAALKIKRFQMFYRVAYFLPYVVASVVNAQIWMNFFNPVKGVPIWLSKTFDWAWADIKFLGRPSLVLYTVSFISNWSGWGFSVVVFLAAMQAISPSLYEAARIEGATRFQQFRYVTLPGIRPTVVFMLLMTVIGSFRVFTYIYLLTQGGPARASEVLGTMVFENAFQKFRVGYASAIGISMSAVSMLVVSVFVILRRRGWDI